MSRKPEGLFLLTRTKMQQDICAGRDAIESSMLLILIRPRPLTKEDDAEMAALSELLKKYNEMMAKHEFPRSLTHAANDEHGDDA